MSFSLTEASILSILTFLLGALIGHRLNLWRDRRSEFNLALEPIRAWLLKVVDNPSAMYHSPGIVEMDAFTSRLGFIRSMRFNSLLKQYREALSKLSVQDAETGAIELSDIKLPKSLAQKMLHYTSRK